MTKKKYLLYLGLVAMAATAFWVDASPQHAAAKRVILPEQKPKAEIVFGVSPDEETSATEVNFALPEDAWEITPEVVIVADTNSGYVRKIEDSRATIIAGDGTGIPDPEKAKASTSRKSLPVLGLLPFDGGFFSFSSRGAGINFHSRDGAVKFVANSYQLDGKVVRIGFIKFSQLHNGEAIALDATSLRNQFIHVTKDGVQAIDTPKELAGLNVAGFDYCGDSLIFSSIAEKGGVNFQRLSNGKVETLFTDRPYSNAIKCVGDDEFLFGARWELKRFKKGAVTVEAGDFVHISSIRPALSKEGEFIITDSDEEVITRWSKDSRSTIATSKGQIFSDPLTNMQIVGNDIIGMTPDNTIIRMNVETKEHTVLLSAKGLGKWDKLLNGHKFTSLRAFYLDDANGVLFLGSNHGIFRMDTKAQTFEPFAGSENEHGRQEGKGTDARFAVIRDLLLDKNTLYVADAWNDKIRAINIRNRQVSTFAGSGNNGTTARNEDCSKKLDYNFNRPLSIAKLGDRLIIANSHSHSLVAVDAGKACLFAGKDAPSKDQYGGGFKDGDKDVGAMSGPKSIFATPDGIIVPDMWNHALRFVDTKGRITTLYSDERLARMISAVVVVKDKLYFSSADSTVKSIPAPHLTEM